MNRTITLAGACLLSLAAIPVSAQDAKSPPGSGLYTTYTLGGDTGSYTVCGRIGKSQGCFATGSFPQRFEEGCAMLEGTAKTKGDVITRMIYILDKRSADNTPVQLLVFRRTDTVSNDDVTVQLQLIEQVSLGITGGSQAQCSMAANAKYVYAGTNVDTNAVSVDKSSYAVVPIGQFVPPATLTSITAEDRGYVSLQFTAGFYLYDPTGNLEGSGGGDAAEVGTTNAWVPN
jgi:hypothetical protein